jgi:hypothetical protein
MSKKQRSLLLRSLIFFTLAFLGHTLFVSPKSKSAIIKSHSLGRFYQEAATADQDTLIVLDIDDVIITKKDRYFKNFATDIRKEIEAKTIRTLPRKTRIKLLSIIYLQVRHRLVDPKIKEVIHDLQQRHIKVICLSRAPIGQFGEIPNIEDQRIIEVGRFNLDFSVAAPDRTHFVLSELSHLDSPSPVYKNGIICVGDYEKGETLRALLHHLQWKPKKIVLVDDLKENITSVQKAAKEKKINFVGLELRTVLDEQGNADKKLMELQAHHLMEHEEWLSDEQAAAKLGRKTNA